MIRKEEVFRIGRLGKPHGVKGEINFNFSDDVFDRVDAEYLVLLLDGILVPFFMEEYRFRSNETALVKFCGIDTAERARELTNVEVFFPHALSDADVDDNMKWEDFVGYQIDGVGQITDVDTATENVLFVVQMADGRQALIPAVDDFIVSLDHSQKTIRMNLPEGMLDL